MAEMTSDGEKNASIMKDEAELRLVGKLNEYAWIIFWRTNFKSVKKFSEGLSFLMHVILCSRVDLLLSLSDILVYCSRDKMDMHVGYCLACQQAILASQS